MPDTSDRKYVSKNRLLYDPVTLEHYADEHGNAYEIKLQLDTEAALYEIRTALRFWLRGNPSHRTSDRIWERCQAIADEKLALSDDDELVHPEVGN